MTIEEYAQSKNSCLIRTGSGLSLCKNHEYYYQVQLQMFCTRTSFCDFVIWSKKNLFIERVFMDQPFLYENIKKAERFHALVIVPELLSRFFTQPICEPVLQFINGDTNQNLCDVVPNTNQI